MKPLTLPCLRGRFGDWVYYDCLFSLQELAARVRFAYEIHESVALSELIQRQLDGKRAKKISTYLQTNTERFFNALVLATYKGDPQWFDVANLRSGKNSDILDEMPEDSLEALGLLRLSGNEEIFALDGQHRLAGIKRALSDDPSLGSELVPVILVGHQNTKIASRRTRRLFTTLNKTAVAVKKLDVISLDEDDVMAITVRRLVEQNPSFKDPKIAVVSSESMPAGNNQAILTIAGLFDQLKLIFLFKRRRDGVFDRDDDLRFNRPDDDILDDYYDFSVAYFEAIGKAFLPVRQFLASADSRRVVMRHRTAQGGHILFRTIGFELFTRAAIALANRDGTDLKAAVAVLTKLPTDLNEAPYRGTIWDPMRSTMKPAGKALARRLVFHMLSLQMSPRHRRDLLADYREALGYRRTDGSIQLPEPVA